MTNYGTLAILALPEMPERQLRLLLALETVPADASDARKISAPLLAAKARLSPNTAAKARNELIDRGMITYQAGTGRGTCSTLR